MPVKFYTISKLYILFCSICLIQHKKKEASGMKKFICRNCGVANEVSEEVLKRALKEDEELEWLECEIPGGFEWILPAGKITPIYGEPIYISGNGEHLSREAYLHLYNIDPEIAYNLMRGRIRMQVASRAPTRPPKARVEVRSMARSRGLLDEDDWTS